MGVKWTKEQEKVISLRDRNILVSAAAGSGKTAVLVQRILSKIMDPNHPVDIDRLLIMTFTRAAAGEMKERISRALEQALYDDPDNEHLQRQMHLVYTAQITTIDGFCSYIIRNYFHLIGLDPGYRTADEGELKLLKEDVLKELIEEAYASKNEKYYDFVECYASGKTDDGIKDYILDVYDAAMSHPYPKEWLAGCLETYKIDTVEELRQQHWMKLLWEVVTENLEEAQRTIKQAHAICLEADGPYLYEEAVNSDILLIEELKAKAGECLYDEMAQMLDNLAFARLPGKKTPDVDESKKEQVKALREESKAALKELKTKFFLGDEEAILHLMHQCSGPMESLTELVLAFMERFAEKKRENNLLDFTDMEHFALKILSEKKEDGTLVMSQAARELSEKYDEVLVDEYQDSNQVQEFLTTCVSGWVNERNNIFMVGDVKQSIYRFRLAKPELFMEKYKTYSLDDGPQQRIDLHKNFRSREQVLGSVNYLFRQIMGEDLGGINYDDDCALYPGAAFPEGARERFLNTEVLMIEKDGEELEDEQGIQNGQELEALAIAQRILQIVDREVVLDKETGEYRKAQYGDIVILLRSALGWAETFSEVLASKGIPAYTASRTGYFSALEVVTVLNYLRICDNPLQDIPMMGVLRSPIVGCSTQEMAMIRSEYPNGMLYESVCSYVEDGQFVLFPEKDEKEVLKQKLRTFLEQLERVRDLAAYTPIHQLILYVLRETGYGDYARALPGGEQRGANLHMLVEKAMDFEKTSYRGLFNFVRYIEKLQKYEVDFGEVNLTGAGSSAVQIMTIHKSKGLEFPIVFAAGMGKQFNFRDMNARLLIHPELGFGADAILHKKRLIIPTLHKQIVRRELLKESLGEELRVLYVALTRAKEKLIMTGTVSKVEKLFLNLARWQEWEEPLFPIGMRMKGRTFWSYVLPALARHRCIIEYYRAFGIPLEITPHLQDEETEFDLKLITARDLVEGEVLFQTDTQVQEELLKNWDTEQIYDEETRKILEERFSYEYPYAHLKDIPVKVSVSELKKRSYTDHSDKEEALFFEPDIVPLIPRFIAGETEEYIGAARGTAYHRVMECLDYSKGASKSAIEEQIHQLIQSKKMGQAEADCIEVSDILTFLESEIGKRMEKAALDGSLYREQPFVISADASEMNPSWTDEETILVQGIIDAYFIEDGEIVVVDYKTDKVRPGEEQRLVDLYHVQLEDYAAALERMLGLKVKETIIYSFTLHKSILL